MAKSCIAILALCLLFSGSLAADAAHIRRLLDGGASASGQGGASAVGPSASGNTLTVSVADPYSRMAMNTVFSTAVGQQVSTNANSETESLSDLGLPDSRARMTIPVMYSGVNGNKAVSVAVAGAVSIPTLSVASGSSTNYGKNGTAVVLLDGYVTKDDKYADAQSDALASGSVVLANGALWLVAGNQGSGAMLSSTSQADTQTATATATGGSGPLVAPGETFSYTEGSVNTEAGASFVSKGDLEASGLPQSFAIVNAQNISP